MTGKLIQSWVCIQLAYFLSWKKKGKEFVSRGLRRQLAVNDRPKKFGKSHGICWKLENRTVGKSHEWPCNVNEAPVTQFCSAPLHPPVFPLLALRRREREKDSIPPPTASRGCYVRDRLSTAPTAAPRILIRGIDWKFAR